MKKILILLFACITHLTFADQFFVCPQTYKTVQIGDTPELVIDACGQPATTSQQQITETSSQVYSQWIYVPPGAIGTTMGTTQINPNQPQLTITFKNNTVTQILLNNQSSANQFPCYSLQRIRIGSSKDDVRSQCGLPASINTLQQGEPQTITVTLWTYKFGPYQPSRIFTFKEGKLSDISMGPVVQP